MLRKEEQERKSLASEMLAAAQLQNDAEERCGELEAKLIAGQSAWLTEREEMEQRCEALVAKNYYLNQSARNAFRGATFSSERSKCWLISMILT